MTITILGMHRSGTSCLARMLSATGDAIRNWDNARGHFELLDLVRLDEAVLAYSGGHWLAAPAQLRWTDAHAAERDRLLRSGLVLKDPRMLLALPFWRASSVPVQTIGIVRHPLAVARSLESWRGMPLVEGIALWTAHNRALAADRAAHGTPIIDFDRPRAEVIAAVRALVPAVDEAAYEDDLVHHDAAGVPPVAGLDEALALHRELAGERAPPIRGFPHAQLAAFHRDLDVVYARAALDAVADTSAVIVPVVTALIRARRFADATALVARYGGELADLLHAKILLAAGEPEAALGHLEVACRQPQPYFQARSLLSHALRAVGRTQEARATLRALAAEALYAHGPLATLAEWSFLDGDRDAALAELAEAIATAPSHRRGRLRTRRAEWLIARGDFSAARAELELAIAEDPGYPRSAEVLAALSGTR
jgi:tetratricopeptide (TPR) repeat protein